MTVFACNRPAAWLVTTLLCLSQIAAADDMRPASLDFPEQKRNLAALIEWPELKGNVSVMLSCMALAQANGKLKDHGCYTKDNFDSPFAEAVNKAARKARVVPALVNGKARTVYLQYRLEFIAEGEERNIHVYLNPGYAENVEAYRYDHIAGQRVTSGKNEPWQDACPERAKYAVWVRAYLGEDGKAANPSIVHASGVIPVARCQDAIKQTIVQSLYTPAMADGVPVPSTFVELFGN